MKKPLPDQPLYIDKQKVIRFRENKVVAALLDYSQNHGFGLNELACMNLPREDWQQMAQLIGYSLSGYSELSYVTDKAYYRAAKKAPKVKRPRVHSRSKT